MLLKIKKRIEEELPKYIENTNKQFGFNKASPLLFRGLKNFALGAGKRIRPTLFIIGYLGYAKKTPPGLYQSALALELLHDFLLIHDDIIDKSDTRRGQSSLHKYFDNNLKSYGNIKFSGTDLAIVAADIMYALSINAFMGIRENHERKEAALRKFISSAIYTGTGEFIELIYGTNKLRNISLEDIYKIYDLKTARYTFASPLSIGATLGGAGQKEIDLLFTYGLYIGRAFQIKDDIIGTFSKESAIGKSNLTDLREAKKTILIWHAYNNSDVKTKSEIEKILSKINAGKTELIRMRKILTDSGSLDYAQRQINLSLAKAKSFLSRSKISQRCKKALSGYCHKILGP
ncbi:MAG: polyprenyl synthetase family protein [Candidatus Omnitrophota bacterium]|nr:polyprenyl synthetase family protein [Candidatus Omnitrophota bacterium]